MNNNNDAALIPFVMMFALVMTVAIAVVVYTIGSTIINAL